MTPTPLTRRQPSLLSRLPSARPSAATALIVGALTAVAIVAQALALASAIDRSLLHHVALSADRTQLVVVVVAIAARAVLAYIGEVAAFHTADKVVIALQVQLLRHALALGPSWLAGERAGELSLTATRGLRSLHAYFARYLPQAAMAAIVPVLLLAWVATQDWLSLVVVVALVAAVPISMIFFGREATKRTARQWRRLASLAGRFLQLIEGLPTLRAFGREVQGRREVEASTEGVRVATMRTLRVAFLSALAMDLIAGFGVGLVAMVLGLRLLWGELTFQTAMAVLLVAPEVFVPLRRAGAEFHASTEGQAAAARVLEVLAVQPASTAVANTDAAALPGAAPEVRMTAVTVHYDDRSAPALDGFSLVVPAGGRVAVVGPSGTGKSSVLGALLRFVEPRTGVLTLDGLAADGLEPATWRRYFSWLPQRPYLFAASLGQNIALGLPTASDDALLRVTDAVGLGPLVAQLPRGLDTPLGQDGLALSAGERQRVALARALLRPAPVLLLDEPTAWLDPPTIAHIARSIDPWLAGRTVIVASHEPALLPQFGEVVRLTAHQGSAAVT